MPNIATKRTAAYFACLALTMTGCTPLQCLGNEQRSSAKLFADLARAIASDTPGKRIGINALTCNSVFSNALPVVECSAELIARGTAVVVRAIRECAGDVCSVDAAIITENGHKVASSGLFDGAVNIELDRDQKHIYADDIHQCHPSGDATCVQGIQIRLIRIDIATSHNEPWAECFSPAASPDGEWVYCRRHDGSVSRFREGTKDLQLFWSNTHKGGIYFVPYAYIYPPPVLFEKGAIVVHTTHADGSDRTVQVPVGATQ